MSTIIGGENEAITHGCRIYLLITENEMDAMGRACYKRIYTNYMSRQRLKSKNLSNRKK
jgi:hypothetical protein